MGAQSAQLRLLREQVLPAATLETETAAGLERAVQAEAAADGAQGTDGRGDEMPSWAADKQQRLARIREAKAAAGDGAEPATTPAPQPPDKAQSHCPDPESRLLKTADGCI